MLAPLFTEISLLRTANVGMSSCHHILKYKADLFRQAKKCSCISNIFWLWKIPNCLGHTGRWNDGIFKNFKSQVLHFILNKSEFLFVEIYATPCTDRYVPACGVKHIPHIVNPYQTVINTPNYISKILRYLVKSPE